MSVGRSEDQLVDGCRKVGRRWVGKVRGCIVRICIPSSKRVANFTWDWLSCGLKQNSGQRTIFKTSFEFFSSDELAVASGVSLSLNAPSIHNTLSIPLSIPKVENAAKTP